ncbi:MAG TPA: cytidylate kinase-like family protein [Candidatus Limnocylindrales bacterium]|jgi:cytidylate kinase
MGVITISSELGTGGVEIAGRVAAELGYALVDERTSDRILRQYGLTKFKELYDSGPSLLDLVRVENLLIISMYNEILEALAKRGQVVILSRVGFAVLGGYADALNVHVVAPMAQRVQRIMAAHRLTDAAAAEEHLREDDIGHHKFVNRFYNRHSDEPAGYGLTVDTGSTSVEDATREVVEAARAAVRISAVAGATTTAAIEVDPVLESAIAEVLEEPVSDTRA